MKPIHVAPPDDLVFSSEEIALHAIREHFPCGRDGQSPELKTCPCDRRSQVWLCRCPGCETVLAFYVSDMSDPCPHAQELLHDLDAE